MPRKDEESESMQRKSPRQRCKGVRDKDTMCLSIKPYFCSFGHTDEQILAASHNELESMKWTRVT